MRESEFQELLWSFARHRVLTVASRTGILGALDSGGGTVEEISKRLGLDPLATGKIVRALCAMSVSVPDGDGYRIDPGLAGMFAPGPDDFGHFLEHSHQMYERWGESLEPWVRGEPWKTRARDSEGVARFGAAMRAAATRAAAAATEVIDLDGVKTLLDVGGGTGAYSMVFCEAAPGLEATVIDTPKVASLGREQAEEAGMGNRVSFRGGDYLDPAVYEGGFDLVLIANVLHQELADRAERLVSLGAGALNPGGRLAVIDFAIDDEGRRSLVGALFAINMRSFGDTHTAPAIRGWMEEAGLSGFEREDFAGSRWLLTARKTA